MGCSSKSSDRRLIERSVFYGPFSSRNISPASKMLLQLREKLHITTEAKPRNNKKKSLQQQRKLFHGTLAEEHETYLKDLDPKDWRMQDHYAVLGLQHSRFNAGENDIKQAYRKLVLRHHPDKRPENERTHKDGDYFTCITKAYEVLGNKSSRRAYDSVDPYFDDNIPDNSTYDASEFFAVFAHYFEYNAKWSDVTPVPLLGDGNTPKEVVERFYNFWFNFRSWRDYSYEFEDPGDNNTMDRAERRWIEKQNKVNRSKQKKEEMSRIRKLVDLAYNNDPRIKKFKQQEREKKLAAKKAREDEIKANKLEAARIAKEAEETERKYREEAEAKKRLEEEAIKAQQTQLKKSLKRIRKNIRDICKQNEYYVDDEKNIIKHMTDLEAICEALPLEELNEFYRELTTQDGKVAFLNRANEIRCKMKEERLNSLNEVNNTSSTTTMTTTQQQQKERTNVGKPWSNKELQLLVKAVNLFPAGTNDRWDVIANFLLQHNQENPNGIVRSSNEVLNKVKEMQKIKQSNAANSNNTGGIGSSSSSSTSSSAATGKVANVQVCNGVTTSGRTWTNTEQQLLERGLKTYSANLNDRWDLIAASIPTRTKEEVLQRYNDLVEAVKAKRLQRNNKQAS